MSERKLEEKYKGWFEGFSNVISDQLGTNIRDEILDKCESCHKVSNDSEMAVCVKEVIDRFDNIVEDKNKLSFPCTTCRSIRFTTIPPKRSAVNR